MLGKFSTLLRDRVPGGRRIARLPRQLTDKSPFEGDVQPTRVRILRPRSDRSSVPFAHPWNYHEPLRILDSDFADADAESGGGRHNGYLEGPGLAPGAATRDPRIERAKAAA